MVASQHRFEYVIEPSAEEVLDYALHALLEAVIYQSLLESIASEHSQRRIAMKNATDNAGEVLQDLKLQYNRKRQATITKEISEISAGAEAMSANE